MNQQPHADIDYDPNADTILSAHDWAINTDMTVTEYATNIQAFRNETLQDWEATTPDELRHMADHIIDALHLDDDRHAAQITAARLIAEQLDYSDKPTATLCAAYVRLLHDLTTQ